MRIILALAVALLVATAGNETVPPPPFCWGKDMNHCFASVQHEHA